MGRSVSDEPALTSSLPSDRSTLPEANPDSSTDDLAAVGAQDAAVEQHASESSERWRPRSAGLRELARRSLIWCLVPFVGTLAVNGFLPGLAPSSVSLVLGAGNIQCLRAMGLARFVSYCHQVGEPLGSPMLTGLPQTFLGTALTYLPLIDPWRAWILVGSLSVLAGYVGAVAVLRRFGAPLPLASLGAFLYLVSLPVLLLKGYFYTLHGFLIIPAATWALLASLDAFGQGRRLRGSILAVVTMWLMVFTDGYSFISFAVLVLIVGIAWLCGDSTVRSKLWAGITWALATGTAALTYVAYVPGGATQTSQGLDSFRFYGADLLTMILPPPTIVWASKMPWAGLPRSLWGAADSQLGNYLGWVSIALVVTAIVLGRLRAGAARRGELIALLSTAVACALLALGPSLKVGVKAPAGMVGNHEPESSTTAWLPTGWIYDHVPGFSDARATYRSIGMTRWMLVVLAIVALTMLLRTRAAKLVPLLALLLVVDSMPDLVAAVRSRSVAQDQSVLLRQTFGADLDSLLGPGDRVLMLPVGNDFLATAFVPFTGAAAFNVGVDKNYDLARARWPGEVRRTIASFDSADFPGPACALLHTDASVIILPFIDLRRGATELKTASTPDPVKIARAQKIAASGKFAVSTTPTSMSLRIPAGRDCR